MKTVTREHAIDLLRERLLPEVDDRHCLCEVAARKGVLCHGFARWSRADLERRFWWLSLREPDMPRAELERLANLWLLERQRRFGAELCCDTQRGRNDFCRGWDEFDEATLARFVAQLCHESVRVAPGERPRRQEPGGEMAG